MCMRAAGQLASRSDDTIRFSHGAPCVFEAQPPLSRRGHGNSQRTLDTWQDLITNYFIDHQISAFVEGLNNKLKVRKRRCYGLSNVGRLFQRLTLDLDGYRRFSPWHAGAY